MEGTAEYFGVRRIEIYRTSVRHLMADRNVTAKERRAPNTKPAESDRSTSRGGGI